MDAVLVKHVLKDDRFFFNKKSNTFSSTLTFNRRNLLLKICFNGTKSTKRGRIVRSLNSQESIGI